MRKNKFVIGKMLLPDLVAFFAAFILDQFTKYLAISRLKNQQAIVLIEGVLELEYLENTGSAFSLFQNKTVFILLLGFMVLAILIFIICKLPQDRRFRIAHLLLAMLIAGAVGNLTDRIRFGFVVDFISFVLIHFPVFNVADCFVVVCTLLLFLLFMFVYKEEDLAFLQPKKGRLTKQDKEKDKE